MHECHANEYGRKAGGREAEEKNRHTIRGRETPQGNVGEREGCGRAGRGGREEQRRVSVTQR